MTPRFRVGDGVVLAHQIDDPLVLPDAVLGSIGVIVAVEDRGTSVKYQVHVEGMAPTHYYYLDERVLEPVTAGRIPYPGWAPYVSADRLARLVHLMGTRVRAEPGHADESVAAPPDESHDSEQSRDGGDNNDEESAAEEVEEAAEPVASMADSERTRPPATPSWASPRLRELRAAPIRVRCLGACEVWHADRLLKIGDPELLLLLAVHPVTGITSETLANMLWDEVRARSGRRLAQGAIQAAAQASPTGAGPAG